MMKRTTLNSVKILPLTICLLLSLLAVRAEEPPARPESFATFWAGFKSAVAKNDKEAVAAATKFPFMEQLSKAAFLQQYPSMFTKKVQKCFATAKPVRTEDRDSYSVFLRGGVFLFREGKRRLQIHGQ